MQIWKIIHFRIKYFKRHCGVLIKLFTYSQYYMLIFFFLVQLSFSQFWLPLSVMFHHLQNILIVLFAPCGWQKVWTLFSSTFCAVINDIYDKNIGLRFPVCMVTPHLERRIWYWLAEPVSCTRSLDQTYQPVLLIHLLLV